jgi:hypothetical protein
MTYSTTASILCIWFNTVCARNCKQIVKFLGYYHAYVICRRVWQAATPFS